MYEIECLTQQNEEVASVEDCAPFLGGCYPEADEDQDITDIWQQ